MILAMARNTTSGPVEECAQKGGCVSDYVLIAVAGVCITSIALGIFFMIKKRNSLKMRANHFPLLLCQSLACIVCLLAFLMSRNVFRLSRGHSWQSCYIWQLWLEGPLGFGSLLSCHIARAYKLHNIFVGRRLPPLRSYILLPLLLMPWFIMATVIQATKGIHNRLNCGASYIWWLVIGSLHLSYIALSLATTWILRNIPFEFNEFKDLFKGWIMCFLFFGIWAVLLAVQTFDGNIKSDDRHTHAALVVTARFLLVAAGNGFLTMMFFIPILDLIWDSLRKRSEYDTFGTMGQVLRVPPSSVLRPPASAFSFTEPLESLLQHKRFRQSFLAFADSRMAGENMHFFNEVRELSKIPSGNTVQRIYMADHIIESYIKAGSIMEINISHRMRSHLLGTKDLADPNLFKPAVKEIVNMMEMNLLKDYWHSAFFLRLKEETEANDALTESANSLEQEILFKKHCDGVGFSDNPFDQVDPLSGELKMKETREMTLSRDISTRSFNVDAIVASVACSEMPFPFQREGQAHPIRLFSSLTSKSGQTTELPRGIGMHSGSNPDDGLHVHSREIIEGKGICGSNHFHLEDLSNVSK